MACWVNYQWLRTESTALEYVHSSTMVLTIAFLAYAAIDLIDRRLLRYTEPGAACILLDHCRGCAKHKDVPCLLNRLFQWTVFSLMVLSLIPLQTSTVPVSYNAEIFGQFRNLMHPLLVQLYEMRVVPLLGGVFLTLTLFGLRCRALRQSESPVVLLSVGVGHLGFAHFRTALLAFFRFDVVKFTFWEEGTELLLIASLIFILWAMRQDLFRGLLDRVVPGRA